MSMQVIIDEAIYAGFKITKAAPDGSKASKVIHQMLVDDKVIKMFADIGTTEVAKIPSGTMVNVSIEGVKGVISEFSNMTIFGASVTVHPVERKGEKRA